MARRYHTLGGIVLAVAGSWLTARADDPKPTRCPTTPAEVPAPEQSPGVPPEIPKPDDPATLPDLPDLPKTGDDPATNQDRTPPALPKEVARDREEGALRDEHVERVRTPARR